MGFSGPHPSFHLSGITGSEEVATRELYTQKLLQHNVSGFFQRSAQIGDEASGLGAIHGAMIGR